MDAPGATPRKGLKVLGFTAAFFLLANLLLWAISGVTGDSILREIESRVQQDTKATIKVRDLSLGFWSSFPLINVGLEGIRLLDAEGKPLLRADELDLRFHAWDLLRGNHDLRVLALKKASIDVRKLRDGSWNYEILKDQGTGKPQESTEFSLRKLLLQEVEVRAALQAGQKPVAFRLTDSRLKLELKRNVLTIQTDLEGRLPRALTYGPWVDVALAGEVRYGLLKQDLVFRDLQGSFSGLEFRIAGTSVPRRAGWDTHLALDASGSDAEDLAPLFNGKPFHLHRGRYRLALQLDGLLGPGQVPPVKGELSLRQARATLLQGKHEVKNLEASGNFRTLGRSLVLENTRLSGILDRVPFSVAGNIQVLPEFQAEISASARIPLAVLLAFSGASTEDLRGGQLSFRNLKVRYPGSQGPEIQGKLEVSGIDYASGGENLRVPMALVNLDPDQCRIRAEEVRWNGQTLDVEGVCRNYREVLSGKQQTLQLDGKLQASTLDIRALLPDPSKDRPASATLPAVQGKFVARVGAMRYKNWSGRDFEGRVELSSHTWFFTGDLETLDGAVSVEGTLGLEGQKKLEMVVQCDGVRVEQMFRQMDQFGQKTLTDRNLSGELSGTCLVEARLDEEYRPDLDRLHVLAAGKLGDGRLYDFKPLRAFSTFVHVEDLQDIRFRNMTLWMEISEGKVFLPATVLQNNAMNLTLCGTHSFDNRVEYYVRVNGAQVLMDMFRRHDRTLSPKPVRQSNWFDLYYTIRGTAGDPVVKAAREYALPAFDKSLAHQKSIRERLEAEVGSLQDLEVPAPAIALAETAEPAPAKAWNALKGLTVGDQTTSPVEPGTEPRKKVGLPTLFPPVRKARPVADAEEPEEEAYLNFEIQGKRQ